MRQKIVSDSFSACYNLPEKKNITNIPRSFGGVQLPIDLPDTKSVFAQCMSTDHNHESCHAMSTE